MREEEKPASPRAASWEETSSAGEDWEEEEAAESDDGEDVLVLVRRVVDAMDEKERTAAGRVQATVVARDGSFIALPYSTCIVACVPLEVLLIFRGRRKGCGLSCYFTI